MLDRPISDADAAGDAIRQPVVKPDRDVRPSRIVLIDLGARLKLPGFVNADGTPKYPGAIPDYIVNHERKPGVGMLAGWRGANGDDSGIGAANPRATRSLHRQSMLLAPRDAARGATTSNHGNTAYLEFGRCDGLSRSSRTDRHRSSIARPLQKFRLAARGHGALQRRSNFASGWRPLRSAAHLVCAVRGSEQRRTAYPLPRPYPTADGDVSLLGIAERLAAPDPSASNWLYIASRDRRASSALPTTTGSRVTSHTAPSTCRRRRWRASIRDTVWTWNAIGKRAGAWNLAPGVAEATRGFLLNHLIRDLLAARGTAAIATPMPTRSPGRPPGTTCASASRKLAGVRRPQRAASFRRLQPRHLPQRPELLRLAQNSVPLRRRQ